MTKLDDMALLRKFVAEESEAAFQVIVSRHLDMVYFSALRQTRDPHVAQEMAQVTFIILARKAHTLGPRTILPGWLFRTVRFVAKTEQRTRLRRLRHETEAHMEALVHQQTEPSE